MSGPRVLHILKKDWTLLWPMVVLVIVIQAASEWVAYGLSVANTSPTAGELIRPLTLAWFVGIAALTAAVAQQDAIPGMEQDWLLRPLQRRDLLMAKLLFLLVTVSAPMFALNMAHVLYIGFPLADAVAVLAYKEVYVFLFLIVPVLGLASTTRNMTELTVMGGALPAVRSTP